MSSLTCNSSQPAAETSSKEARTRTSPPSGTHVIETEAGETLYYQGLTADPRNIVLLPRALKLARSQIWDPLSELCSQLQGSPPAADVATQEDVEDYAKRKGMVNSLVELSIEFSICFTGVLGPEGPLNDDAVRKRGEDFISCCEALETKSRTEP